MPKYILGFLFHIKVADGVCLFCKLPTRVSHILDKLSEYWEKD